MARPAGSDGVSTSFEIDKALLAQLDTTLAGMRNTAGYKVTKRQFFDRAVRFALADRAFMDSLRVTDSATKR